MAIKRTSSNSISNAVKLSTGFASAAIPNSPTIGTATATSDVAATVTYTAAVLGATGSTFTATSNPGSVTGTGSSPITVTGLTASTSYTFSVTAGNANGTSAASSASNSITTSEPAADPAYESIATVTLGSSNNSITFSSIPSTYKHLQMRISALSTGNLGTSFCRINGDTNVANYVTHYFTGNGSTTTLGVIPSNSGRSAYLLDAGVSQNSIDYPLVSIIDFVDYTNTNKYKVMRTLSGEDTNGTNTYVGAVGITSGLYLSTSAISTLNFFLDANSYATNTKFALYGIKG